MPDKSKACTRCTVVQPLKTGFYRDKTGNTKDGYRAWCKDCMKSTQGAAAREYHHRKQATSNAYRKRKRTTALRWYHNNKRPPRKDK